MQIAVPYEKAEAQKFPEQVAVILAKDDKGMCNPVTVGWIMPVSMEPPMWAFSLAKVRYSLEAIRHSKEFVISLPSEAMTEATTFYGTHSGRQMDKLKEFPVETQPAASIDGVLLSGAVANFECTLEAEYITGDCVTVVGRVVASHMHAEPSVRRAFILNPDLDLGGFRAVADAG
jgi:flavin reductase (DIM6/NTAB) family NADH-FMN oxidoreductase RutF